MGIAVREGLLDATPGSSNGHDSLNIRSVYVLDTSFRLFYEFRVRIVTYTFGRSESDLINTSLLIFETISQRICTFSAFTN